MKSIEKTEFEISRVLKLQAEIGIALLATAPLPEMLDHCVTAIVTSLDASFARIWTLNETEGVLELQASAGLYTHLNGPHSRVPVGRFKIGLIAQERLPHLTNSVIGDPRVNDQEWARREGMVSFAGYPLLVEDRLVGVLAMFSQKTLPQTTLTALGTVANFVALGIERKLSEKALRDSEELGRQTLRQNVEKFQTLADSMPQMVWTARPDGFVEYYNQRWLNYTGLTLAETQGWKWKQTQHPEDVQASVDKWLASLATGEAFENEMRFLRASDRSWRWHFTRAVPVHAESGAIIQWIGTCTDIEDRKIAELELRQAREELENHVAERTVDLRREIVERQKAEADLRELNGKLLNLRDIEQRRIARELHDSAGQLLTATTMSLASAARESGKLSPEAAYALTEAAELVQETIKEVRIVSHLLHPPLLDEAGLPSSLSWYLEGFSKRGGVQAELEISEGFGRLPGDFETAIFRIVQECLTNIHRHSGSKTATIKLLRLSDEVQVAVEDRGKGMSRQSLHGVGLRGMKERVMQLGGKLEIESNEMGTKVVARLPLKILSHERVDSAY